MQGRYSITVSGSPREHTLSSVKSSKKGTSRNPKRSVQTQPGLTSVSGDLSTSVKRRDPESCGRRNCVQRLPSMNYSYPFSLPSVTRNGTCSFTGSCIIFSQSQVIHEGLRRPLASYLTFVLNASLRRFGHGQATAATGAASDSRKSTTSPTDSRDPFYLGF